MRAQRVPYRPDADHTTEIDRQFSSSDPPDAHRRDEIVRMFEGKVVRFIGRAEGAGLILDQAAGGERVASLPQEDERARPDAAGWIG